MGRKVTLMALLGRLGHVRRYRLLPPGVHLAYDIAFAFPGFRVETIFDVGANMGQSAEFCHKNFAQAQIYSFEPVLQTYQILTHMVRPYPRVRCFNLALGAYQGQGQMVLQGERDRFFLADRPAPLAAESAVEQAEVTTLDAFCQAHGVAQISYLKVDTEGSDLEVLRGAQGLLAGQRIDLVEVEAGMNAANAYHVPFATLQGHLEGLGYALFAIYEQMSEWPAGEPQLRRANLVFISRRMVDRYRVAR